VKILFLFLFLIFNLIALYLLLPKPIIFKKTKVDFWLAGYLFFYSLGFLAAIIDPLPKTRVADQIIFGELIARGLSAISFRFAPWMFLSIFIKFSNLIREEKKNYFIKIFLIPIILFFVYDFVFLKDSWIFVYLDYSNQFFIVSLLVGFYTMVGNFLIILELLKKQKKYPFLKNEFEGYKYFKDFGLLFFALFNICLYLLAYLIPSLNHNHTLIVSTAFCAMFILFLFFIFASTIGFCGLKLHFNFKLNLKLTDADLAIFDKYLDKKLNNSEKKIALDLLKAYPKDLPIKSSMEKYSLAKSTVKNLRSQIFDKLEIENQEDLINLFYSLTN